MSQIRLRECRKRNDVPTETADCLDVEPATVKSRYHRARKILQQRLVGLVEMTTGDAFPFAGERCDRIVAGVFQRLGICSRE